MTAREAQALVTQAYPSAFEESRRRLHKIYSGPINRVVIGAGGTSARAWKSAALHVKERFPQLSGLS